MPETVFGPQSQNVCYLAILLCFGLLYIDTDDGILLQACLSEQCPSRTKERILPGKMF